MKIPTESLNPKDFEKLANSIVEKKFSKEIRGFPEGPDSGIDGIDDTVSPTIIVQSKRYQSNTNQKDLVRLIKKEIEELEQTIKKFNYSNDIDYVIVTSGKLSPENRKKVRELKPNWIKEEYHIIDASELEKLSDDKDYEEIFLRYDLKNGRFGKEYIDIKKKLVNLEELMCFDDKYIVETTLVDKCYQSLLNNRIIFLVGAPGVGKSITSKYLGLKFKNTKGIDKTSVLIKSTKDIDNIINSYNTILNNEIYNNELLVIFDDFLGRNSFECKEKELKDISRICNIAKNNKNLFIIFNSRIEILEQATNLNNDFATFINFYKDKKIYINLSDLTIIEKAKIIRKNFENEYNNSKNQEKNNIFLNYENFRRDLDFNIIINHKNFNPRIIEHICRRFKEDKMDFKKNIVDFLNNPKELYNEVFLNLSENKKLFLYIVSLFSEFPVKLDIICEIFSKIPHESGTIEDVVSTLKNSWIKVIKDENNNDYIDTMNPGIIDYLRIRLIKDDAMSNKIINYTPYLFMIQKLDREKFNEIIVDKKFDKYKDRDKFLGNKLSGIIMKELSIACEEFKELTRDFSGIYYEEENGRFKEKSWKDIIRMLNFSELKEYKNILDEEVLWSKENDILINKMLKSNDIVGLIYELDILLFENTESLMENEESLMELLDLSEESTGSNIFQMLFDKLEKYVIELLSNPWDMSLWVEEYFENRHINKEDYSDIEINVELLDKIIKYSIDEIKDNRLFEIPKRYYEDIEWDNNNYQELYVVYDVTEEAVRNYIDLYSNNICDKDQTILKVNEASDIKKVYEILNKSL